ncbi:MAG: MFS transporter [Bacillota bacterium]|nr:MFS transporter [Bacillota bacterium]
MGKTTFKEKIGYGIASLGDAVGYSLTGTFLLFFLTTIAGISPGIAGTIVAVGAVWNAVVNPLIGYFADKVCTRFGRRRPLIFVFTIPLMLTMFLLFTDVPLPMAVKPIYYGFLLMLYWTSYTGFIVPYLALGVDYTSDYDDRTSLRLCGSFFNMIGAMFAMVMPTLIVEFLEGLGLTGGQAWSMTGLLLGVITLVTNMATVVAAKGKDVCPEEELRARAEGRAKRRRAKSGNVNIVKEYVSVAMLKPMRPLIAASLAALVGGTIITADMVYYLTYNIGMTAVGISGFMLAKTLLGMAFIPLMSKMIAATDRRDTLMISYIVGSIGLCLSRMLDLTGITALAVYLLFASICTSIYWQVMPGVFYDVCEYDRIKNGRNRSATIVSFQGLVEALAAGIGGQLLGLILEAAGFTGETSAQSETAQLWIENSATVIPVIFFVIAIIALYKYPLNKRAYNELLKEG